MCICEHENCTEPKDCILHIPVHKVNISFMLMGVIVLSPTGQPSLCHFGSIPLNYLYIHLSTSKTHNCREHKDKSQKQTSNIRTEELLYQ